MYHLFFEQSGTFKKALEKKGFSALDYDIENRFHETDIVIDLFAEIKRAFFYESSIFDIITPGDTIIAFFPCVRFESQFCLIASCNASQYKDLKPLEKLKMNTESMESLNYFITILNMFVSVCIRKKIPLIIENPYGKPGLLRQYWPFKPQVVIADRRKYGDKFPKPTAFWFFNCEPNDNPLFEPLCEVKEGGKAISETAYGIERSVIAPEFADWFLSSFVLQKEVSHE